MKPIELKRKIRWADADAAGRIYFARIFDYAAEGEAELIRSLGLSRKELRKNYDFPRVHAECSFKKSMDLDASITLRLWPGKLGNTSIRYDFEVFLDAQPDELAAKGSITVVVLRNGKPAAIPSEIRSAYE